MLSHNVELSLNSSLQLIGTHSMMLSTAGFNNSGICKLFWIPVRICLSWKPLLSCKVAYSYLQKWAPAHTDKACQNQSKAAQWQAAFSNAFMRYRGIYRPIFFLSPPTFTGFEPRTFELPVQCSNHQATAAPYANLC